jgi:hypothetical protein
MTAQTFVPCAPLLGGAAIDWPSFRDRLVRQRLDQRTAFIRTLLDERNPYWSEALYLLIARSLGQPVNTGAFLAIAKAFPLAFLLRRRTDTIRLESLFIHYAASLDPPLSAHRMRPAHSPAVRLRQLAALLLDHSGRFTLLLESDHPEPVLRTLAVKGLGMMSRQSIVINAYIPLLYAYGVLRAEPQMREKAIRWLSETPSENNRIIRGWRDIGMTPRSAADTQALLELRKNYCLEKKCLDCSIGRHLLMALPATDPHTFAAGAAPATPLPAS